MTGDDVSLLRPGKYGERHSIGNFQKLSTITNGSNDGKYFLSLLMFIGCVDNGENANERKWE